MNDAAQILEHIKTLPASEQEAFAEIFWNWRFGRDDANKGKPVDWSGQAARRKAIFGDKVLPNMVLEAREMERY